MRKTPWLIISLLFILQSYTFSLPNDNSPSMAGLIDTNDNAQAQTVKLLKEQLAEQNKYLHELHKYDVKVAEYLKSISQNEINRTETYNNLIQGAFYIIVFMALTSLKIKSRTVAIVHFTSAICLALSLGQFIFGSIYQIVTQNELKTNSFDFIHWFINLAGSSFNFGFCSGIIGSLLLITAYGLNIQHYPQP